MMTALGIVIVATGGSSSVALVGGILLLAFCATALAGYTLGTIFVTRGASLAAVQNDFLSQVSHELRTPLTSIRMFIDTLREERVTDAVEKQRCLSIIDRELGRLDGLVGRLIELSKLESRHTVFDRRPVAVGDVIDDAMATLKTMDLATGTDIKVNVRVDRSLLVHGDREALGRALGNLLSNAWKYTRPEGKRDRDRDARRRETRLHLGDRQRRRHRAGRAGSHLREVPSQRLGRRGRRPGQRPRAGDRPRHRQGAPRSHRRPLRGRSRRELPDHAAPPLPRSGVTDTPTVSPGSSSSRTTPRSPRGWR